MFIDFARDWNYITAWATFVLTCIVLGIFLILPGFLIAKALKFNNISSLCISPILSLFLILITTVGLPILGIHNNGYITFAIITIIALAVFLIGKFAFKRKPISLIPSTSSNKLYLKNYFTLSCYLLVALGLAIFMFISLMDDPNTFHIAEDNVFHLDSIKNFILSGNYSVTSCNIYYPPTDGFATPFSTKVPAFYPALFHTTAALGASITGATPALAINALNSMTIIIIIPLSSYCFISYIFKNKRIVLTGALIFLAFAAYPWYLLHFGPLFTNMFGYALIPVTATIFMALFYAEGVQTKIKYTVLVIACAVVTVIAHPNAIFGLVVFLFPFIIYFICCYKAKIDNERKVIFVKAILCITFALATLAFWIICYKLPYFQLIVTFHWPAFTDPVGAISNMAFMSLTIESLPQICLGILTLIGAIYLIYAQKQLWLLGSLAIILCIYVADVASDGWWKHFLSGFWYTDTYRVAALVAMFCIPLATCGLYACFLGASKLFKKIKIPAPIPVIGLCLIFCLINYYPISNNTEPAGPCTDMSYLRNMINYYYSSQSTKFIDHRKLDFVEEAKNYMDPNATVINIPADGSVFTYSADNLDIYYRCYVWPREEDSIGDTTDSNLIRHHLAELLINPEVSQAVKNVNAKYVIKLNSENFDGTNSYIRTYADFQWQGILDVKEGTPGFKLLLKEGDMCLYEIL